jgi:predicted ATPase
VKLLVLEGIPQLDSSKFNEAKRFVTLIDALYEGHVRLICSAEAEPEKLYLEGVRELRVRAHGQPAAGDAGRRLGLGAGSPRSRCKAQTEVLSASATPPVPFNAIRPFRNPSGRSRKNAERGR